MKNYAVMALSSLILAIYGADAVQNGNKIVLSNSIMDVTIDLEKGARVCSLKTKPGDVEWTTINKSAGGSGLFADSLHNPYNHKLDLSYTVKKYNVVQLKDGKTAEVTVCSPKGQSLDIQKTFRLPDNSDKLTVHYEITNPGSKDFASSFRSGNGFKNPDVTTYQLRFPNGKLNNQWTAAGNVKKVDLIYDIQAGKSSNWFIHQPEHDFVSVTTKHGTMVMEFPFKYLELFYNWQSHREDGLAIVDYFSTPFQIPPLSKGKAEAALHAVEADPLAKYKYCFDITLRLVRNFDYASYKPVKPFGKSDEFMIRTDVVHSYTDFNTPAIIRNPKPVQKIKILALTIALGNHEMNEMQRRLNPELMLVETSNLTAFRPTPYLGWEIPMPEQLLRRELKKDYQVLLICGHSDSKVPKDLREAIHKKIENGATLIYVGDKNMFRSVVPEKGGRKLPADMWAGTLFERLPVAGDVVEFTLGKGKIIQVKFPMTVRKIDWIRESRMLVPHLGTVSDDFPVWEYYFAFYGKLFRYAANQKVPTSIQSIDVSPKALTLKIKADNAVPQASLSLVTDTPLERQTSKKVWQGDLKAGINTITVPETRNLDGEYFYHFVLNSKSGTLDWFDAAAKNQPANRIAELKFAKTNFAKDEAASGMAAVIGKGDIRIILRESATGRVADCKEIKNASGNIYFTLKRAFGSYEKLYDVVAQMMDEQGKIISRKSRFIRIRPDRMNPEKIRPMVWGTHVPSWRDRLFYAEMADAGILFYEGAMASSKTDAEFRDDADWVMRNGMEYLPLGIEHFKGTSRRTAPSVRIPCLRDPKYQKYVMDKTSIIGHRMNDVMSDGGLISDEMTLGTFFNTPHDFCTSQWCLAAFREVLKGKYNHDLTKLNKNWKSSFKTWDEIVPDTLAQAEKKQNFTSWIEHRLFMTGNMTEISRKMAQTVKKLSGGELGVSGIGITETFKGFDLLDCMEFMKNSANYTTPFTIDAIRSYMKPEYTTGSYTEYFGVRYQIWSQIIGGLRMPSIWWYGHMMRRGDARLSEHGTILKNRFALIRNSGASTVLGYGKRRLSPVTLICSTPSLIAAHAAHLSITPGSLKYNENLNSWSQLIRDMGMDAPNVLKAADLAKITPATHPVVILPMTFLLTSQQKEILKKYVRNGGYLIADFAPGIYNEYCVFSNDRDWAALFGVKSFGNKTKSLSQTLYIGNYSPAGIYSGAEVEVLPSSKVLASIGTKVKVTHFGGIQLNDKYTPDVLAGIASKYGKGKTLYLNFAILEYYQDGRRREIARTREMVEAMKQLLQIAGKYSQLPPNNSNAMYELDGVQYYFLSRDKSDSEGDFKINFDKPGCIYDMLQGKYCGKGDSISGKVEEKKVRMFGVYPEKLQKLQGNISFDGRCITVNAFRKDMSSSHGDLARLNVFHDGKLVMQFSQTLRFKERINHTIDLGLIPVSGKWYVVLTGCADGSKIEKFFNITK